MASAEDNRDGGGNTAGDEWSKCIQRAEKCKAEGNGAFSEKKYEEAEKIYGYGIALLALLDKEELHHSLPRSAEEIEIEKTHVGSRDAAQELRATLRSNRAMALLRLGKGKECVSECDLALQDKPHCGKALYRRAKGHVLEKRFDRAAVDLQTALQRDPTNKVWSTLCFLRNLELQDGEVYL